MKLYQSDCQLPGIQALFDVESLAQRLGPWLADSNNLQISIRNIRYKPNTNCFISYRVETENNVTHLHAKALKKEDWQLSKRGSDHDQRRSQGQWVDDELGLIAFRFPTDIELPAVERLVHDPMSLLSTLISPRLNIGTLERMEALAYKPNRRFTARLDFDSGRKLAVKVYDEKAIDRVIKTVRALKKLPLGSPHRIGKSQRHRTVVYEWLHGTTLDFSRLDTDGVESMMRTIIEYLERLRSEALPKRLDLVDKQPTDSLKSIADYLSQIYPPIAKLAHQICDQILVSLQATSYQPELVHGDFHESQIIVGDAGVNACDFDNCCLNDPTVDLANLLAHLQYRLFQGQVPADVVRQTNELSLRYFGCNRDAAMAGRFQWNQYASMFRLATHPFRSGIANWMEQTEDYLDKLLQKIVATRIQFSKPNIESSSSKSDRTRTKAGNSIVRRPNSLQRQILKDDKFAFLENAFVLEEAQQTLRLRVPQIQKAYGAYQLIGIVPLRHKPGRRCLIEYSLLTAEGTRSVIGKVSAKRLDRQTLDIQTALYRWHGFDDASADRISVPRPMGYFDDWRMWFQEKKTGEPGALLLEENRLGGFICQISAAVSKLHASHYCPVRRHTISDELEVLARRLESTAADLPRHSDEIKRIFRNCVAMGEELDEGLVTPIHRDFYQDQILLSEDRTYLVDLDLLATGHPALDVGNFLAHLTEHAIRVHGDPAHWQEEEKQFAEHYLAHNPAVSSNDISSFKSLSLARHISISWQMPERRHCTPQIIDATLIKGVRPL